MAKSKLRLESFRTNYRKTMTQNFKIKSYFYLNKFEGQVFFDYLLNLINKNQFFFVFADLTFN